MIWKRNFARLNKGCMQGEKVFLAWAQCWLFWLIYCFCLPELVTVTNFRFSIIVMIWAPRSCRTDFNQQREIINAEILCPRHQCFAS